MKELNDYPYLPQVYQGIFDAMEKNDLVTARKLQQKSIDIVKVIIKYGGGVRGGKAIMRYVGVDCGPCRLPIHPFGEEEYECLQKDLEANDFFNKKV